VWVTVWTAKVAGSVQVEQSELEKVQGLESVKALVPMLVSETVEVEELRSQLVWEKVKEPALEQLESVLARRSETEKVQMSETAKESALKKGWAWVLGQEQDSPKQ
jgi:hypothetical protein